MNELPIISLSENYTSGINIPYLNSETGGITQKKAYNKPTLFHSKTYTTAHELYRGLTDKQKQLYYIQHQL
jgi:hypothetical protein